MMNRRAAPPARRADEYIGSERHGQRAKGKARDLSGTHPGSPSSDLSPAPGTQHSLSSRDRALRATKRAEGVEEGSFDTRWLLFLIPLLLLFFLLLVLAWRLSLRRRRRKAQRSSLRNVTLVIADEERAEEKLAHHQSGSWVWRRSGEERSSGAGPGAGSRLSRFGSSIHSGGHGHAQMVMLQRDGSLRSASGKKGHRRASSSGGSATFTSTSFGRDGSVGSHQHHGSTPRSAGFQLPHNKVRLLQQQREDLAEEEAHHSDYPAPVGINSGMGEALPQEHEREGGGRQNGFAKFASGAGRKGSRGSFGTIPQTRTSSEISHTHTTTTAAAQRPGLGKRSASSSDGEHGARDAIISAGPVLGGRKGSWIRRSNEYNSSSAGDHAGLVAGTGLSSPPASAPAAAGRFNKPAGGSSSVGHSPQSTHSHNARDARRAPVTPQQQQQQQQQQQSFVEQPAAAEPSASAFITPSNSTSLAPPNQPATPTTAAAPQLAIIEASPQPSRMLDHGSRDLQSASPAAVSGGMEVGGATFNLLRVPSASSQKSGGGKKGRRSASPSRTSFEHDAEQSQTSASDHRKPAAGTAMRSVKSREGLSLASVRSSLDSARASAKRPWLKRSNTSESPTPEQIKAVVQMQLQQQQQQPQGGTFTRPPPLLLAAGAGSADMQRTSSDSSVSWAYKSRAEEWRAARQNSGAFSPVSMQRTPSIGAAGSVFKETFDDADDGEHVHSTA